MRVKLPGCWPIVVIARLSHWRPNGTSHGPKSNPQFAAAHVCRLGLDPRSPSSGWRLWLYFRGGYACHGDLMIDRRER